MANQETYDFKLTGQVAIVTGGGRGIGRAIAQTLAMAGVHVAVAARTPDQLDQTVALIQQQGGQAIPFALDVTDQPGVERMVEETTRRFGPVDLLVNNAGMAGDEAPIWEVDAVAWWRVMEVNLQGPFLCARAVLPGMIAQNHGRIINVSSGLGADSTASYSAYSVSKAALLRLTDCLAEMTTAHGIHVFAISPGLVKTEMTLGLPIYQDVPDSEWIPAERAAELCLFLACGKADQLSGRYVHVTDDIAEMVAHAHEIVEKDLHVLRMRK